MREAKASQIFRQKNIGLFEILMFEIFNNDLIGFKQTQIL